MFAVEFQAIVRDDTIEIPDEYKGQFRNLVRVIVLAEERKAASSNFIDQLLKNPLRLKSFRPLTREEVYVR
jgi:hypothetical protein